MSKVYKQKLSSIVNVNLVCLSSKIIVNDILIMKIIKPDLMDLLTNNEKNVYDLMLKKEEAINYDHGHSN